MGGVNTMGAGSGNALYFGLYGGDIVIEFDDKKELEKKLEKLGLDPDDIESRKRTKGKKEGQKVYYYTFNNIEGMLTNVFLNVTDFGEFLNLELTNGDQKYILSLGDVFSRHAKDFIRRMEGIDLDSELAIGTWSMEGDNGRTYSGVRLYQNKEKIDYVLETEDLPEPIKRKKGKKVEWDYSDQEEFLYEKIETWMKDNFKPDLKNGSDDDDDDEDRSKNKKKGKKDKKKKKDKKSESKGKSDDDDNDDDDDNSSKKGDEDEPKQKKKDKKKSNGLTGKDKPKERSDNKDDKPKKKMPWDKK